MPVTVDLYEGAFGTTLRVSTSDPGELLTIADTFSHLANGSLKELTFAQMVPANLTGLAGLYLASLSGHKTKNFSLTANESEALIGQWQGSADYWQDCLEKLEVLLEAAAPGHQYLTTEGVDDALVELCFMED